MLCTFFSTSSIILSIPSLIFWGLAYIYLISFDVRFLWIGLIGLDILYVLVIHCSNACIDIAVMNSRCTDYFDFFQ